MAKVHITNVVVLDNPSSFFSPFQFELTFECIEELKEDLEWKMIYVGSAESEEYDQVLDTIYVGPVPEGRHIFVFEADPPDVTKIPEQDAVGVTIVLLTCSYRGQEFVRVGYFINNDYADPELRENPPTKPIFERLTRNILATKPRVTRFKINWDDAPTTNGQSTSAAAAAAAAGANASAVADANGMRSSIYAMNGHCDYDEMSDGSLPAPSSAQIMSNMSATQTNSAAAPARNAGQTIDDAMDDNSLAMPIQNGVHALNENSNSLAMEC